MDTKPPRWDLSNVYSGLDAPELTADIDWVKAATEALFKFYQGELVPLDDNSSADEINRALGSVVDQLNQIIVKASTIGAYFHSFIATDSYNQQAMRMNSQFEQVTVEIDKVNVLLQAWIGQVKEQLPAALKLGGSAEDHAFAIVEIAEQSQYMMSEKEEILASELGLSSANT